MPLHSFLHFLLRWESLKQVPKLVYRRCHEAYYGFEWRPVWSTWMGAEAELTADSKTKANLRTVSERTSSSSRISLQRHGIPSPRFLVQVMEDRSVLRCHCGASGVS